MVSSLAVILVLTLNSIHPALAQKTSDIPLTISIADVGATGSPFLVRSDQKGSYVTKTVNKTRQVEAVLLTNSRGHDWALTTYYASKGGYAASDRRVFFDLREQVAYGAFATPLVGYEAAVPVEYGLATAHLIGKCSMVNVDMVKMTAGAAASCPGTFRFKALDGQWYRLSFQPENFPHVDRMKVSCERADATGCREWLVVPGNAIFTADDPNPKSLHALVNIDEGGAQILGEGGDYLLSFAIRLTR
jgi:hypothetical protein